jgi:hypothetical protein
MKYISAIESKEIEDSIKKLERQIYYEKLGSNSNEYMEMQRLTRKLLKVTKPIEKHSSTNTNQNHF